MDDTTKDRAEITLRDFYAGHTLNGLMTQPNIDRMEPARLAGLIFQVADAVMRERDKPQPVGQ